MLSTREKILLSITPLIGVAVWLFVMKISGETEAWDSPWFFPISLIVTFVLGFVSPEHPWIWGIALTILQPVVMVLLQPETGPLFVVGMFSFAVFAGLFCIGGLAGAFVNKKLKKGKNPVS